MLNERTADPAVDSGPIEPSPAAAVAGLRRMADFLEGFPGTPSPYVVVHGDGAAGVQIPSHSTGPVERCLAVARIAQAAGGRTVATSLGDDEIFFETYLLVEGYRVHVYTSAGKRGEAA